MKRRTFGDEADPDLVVVLGWGNRWDHENVRWLIDVLVADGYRAHAFEIPTTVRNYRREWVAPVARYAAELGAYRVLGHSTGGLIAAHLDGSGPEPAPMTCTLLSPFFGFAEGPTDLLVPVLARLPIAAEVLPTSPPTREAIGDLATDRQLASGPHPSPTFLRESRRAQTAVPPIDDAVVFCTLRDQVVSVRAIGERVPPERIVLFDGGHELFSSSCRTDHRHRLLAAVADGPAAVVDS